MMDFTFLYYWDGYYFLQGFWFDVKELASEADPGLIAVAFIGLLALLLLLEIKRYRPKSWFYIIIAAIYYTFLLTVTLIQWQPKRFSVLSGHTKNWQIHQ